MLKIFQLENGMKLVIQPSIDSSLCTMGIWINEGSRSEDISEHGIAHFIEHMIFKGTKTRSAFDIISEIEAKGGAINAYTSYETVAYHATVLSEYYLPVLKILIDIIQNSTFPSDELIKEQDVVIQEIGQSADDPSDNVFDYLRQLCYPNHPLGRTILGTPNKIKSLNSEILHDYVSKHYTKNNMAIVFVGNIDIDVLCKNVESLVGSKIVGELNNGSLELKNAIVCNPFEAAKWVGGSGSFSKKIQQVHMAISFPGLSYSDGNYPKLFSLASILGSGMSSRLFTEIREKNGLAYSVSSFVQGYKDSGSLCIYVITSPDLINKCATIIGNEILKIQDKVHTCEIDRLHAQINTDLISINESSYSRANQIAKHLFYYGNCPSLNELKEKFYSIQAQNILEMSANIFEQKPSISLLGSNEGYDLADISSKIIT